jgi:iron complex outermembrane receptor protein
MTRFTIRSGRDTHTWLAAGLWLSASAPVLAGEAGDRASAPAAVTGTVLAQSSASTQLETVQVTGSRIPRPSSETAAPVQTLTRKEIEASAKPTVADVVQSVAASGQGNLPTTYTIGFAPGSAGVSLRGLGLNSTLVLINGRRMPAYPFADDGVRSFVDLNSIPLDVVDRIDVLKDGASAIYGSDAIAGVVNIILRQDYRGAALGTDFGVSNRGDGVERRLHGAFGTGSLASDGYNVFLSFDGSNADAIRQTERHGYLGTNDLRPYGYFDDRAGAVPAGYGYFGSPVFPFFAAPPPSGVILKPGTGTNGVAPVMLNMTPCPGEVSSITGECLYDFAAQTLIRPKQDHLGVFGRGTVRLGSALETYLEASYFYTDTAGTFRGLPEVGGAGVSYNAANPFNPVFFQTFVLPASHPDNTAHRDIDTSQSDQFFAWTTAGAGSQRSDDRNHVLRFMSGLDGELFGGGFDAAIGWMQARLDDRLDGFLQYTPTQNALNDGTLRVDPRRCPAGLFAKLAPTIKTVATTSITLADAHYTRDVFELPGGRELSAAIGAEYRNEKTVQPATPGTDNGEAVGLGYAIAAQNRDVVAAYAEADAPFGTYSDLDLAGRLDHYSDYGYSFTPKLGLKLTPIPQVALRGTYSKAFRAPGAAESGPQSANFSYVGYAVLTTGNPRLQPETARTETLGLVYEPLAGDSLSVDFYRIRKSKEIEPLDPIAAGSELPATGTPNTSMPGTTPGVVGYYGPSGALAAISAPFENGQGTKTQGLDFDARAKQRLGPFGKLSADLTWTHIITFTHNIDGTNYQYVGTSGPFITSSATGTPADRGVLSLTWEKGAWSTTATTTYVGPLELIDHHGETLSDNGDGTFATSGAVYGFYVANPAAPACGIYKPDGTPFANCRIHAFTTIDLFGKWTGFKHWALSGSVRNLLDVKAPLDPYTYGGPNYNPAWHQSGAVGRYFTLGATYTFR